MAMTLLPRFFALKYGGKYLTITDNIPAYPGFQKFDEEQIWSPRVKFAVEQAETGGGGLVHIRSCYNNKYWVAVRISNRLWIVAAGDKPEEDQSKDSCSLFEPSSSRKGTVSLRHVQTGNHLINGPPGPFYPTSMFQGALLTQNLSALGVFDVFDLETLVILPSQVSFRSEGNYLCSRVLDCQSYQRFESGLDVGDPLVAKELFPTPDGNYRVKDAHFGKFWRGSPNWIWADGEDNNNNNDTLFSIVKINDDDNVFALRNLGNNHFCGALTKDEKANCLSASYPTLTNQTRLVIQETVLDRKISNLKYRLSDSRIYGEQNTEVDHTFATNDSTTEKSNATLHFSITDSKTTSWSNTTSIKFGEKLIFEANVVPFVTSGGKVELSPEFGYTHVWGGSVVDTFIRQSTYSVPVPPSTKMKVTMLCTKAACDVPFSYTQTDLLPSGERVSTIKGDGMFTGMNSYNFRYQSEVVPDN